MRSFRLKLALIMMLVPGTIVLALGTVTWWVLSEQMLDAVDARMSLPASAFSRRTTPRMDAEEFQRLTDSFTNEDGSEANRLGWVVVLRNDSGALISESLPGLGKELLLETYLPLPDDFVTGPEFFNDAPGLVRGPPRPRRGERPPLRNPRGHLHRPPLFFTAESESRRWRVGAFSSLFATVFVGVDLAPFDSRVERMRGYFLSAVLGGLGLTALAGWLIASKAMRPIRRITETAEHITARGLDERIPCTGREDRELARLVAVLNDMMERLERSFHHAVRFSADASHELKTPLAVMQGELERGLKECPQGSAQEQTFLDLSEEVHRLKKITEALLMLSRADAGFLQLNKSTFSISEALISFCEDAHILCAEKDLAFHFDITPGLIVHSDRAVILSVLHNLFSNAIKYNRPGGEVHIHVRRQGQLASIEVANTGPPIPADQRVRVFRRFYRGDDARSRQKDGFGLGLNIALELVHANGGTLRLLDQEVGDEMIRFVVCLALTVDSEHPTESPASA